MPGFEQFWILPKVYVEGLSCGHGSERNPRVCDMDLEDKFPASVRLDTK